ncbi:hypothetical protein [Nonomuraea sp. NEAU-A123]|uniref:hypothetical protein n=1 Tax=Nonomuraea sp. NEAU-A123 TaxID=2839649 RepID=UPI001BE418E6|nr:hypothetical protein [Nonomuraea sp. NEAU-A123]MBT2234910.1 hypothetical protein [Nonomuraea sp. NEAU-A123]
MQGSAAEALSLEAAALRFGAVLAASGPVILTAFGVGRQSVGWFCSATGSHPVEGPYALENVPGELLFWGVLLLPVVVAGLLLRGSRRATLTAVAAVGTVLVFGLVTALLLPGPDPCTGQERAVVLPWPLIVCYPVAAGALILAARSPQHRRPYRIILWAGAAGAAAWVAMFQRCVATYDMRVVSVTFLEIPESPWDGLAWWSGEADRIGLPVVLVALAAATRATTSPRWGRLSGTAAAAALLLFPLLDVAMYISQDSGDFELPFADSVRWQLVVATVLVAWAAWSPRVRISWAGIGRLARSMIRGQSKGMISGRAKNLAVAVAIAAASVWLVVSSFTPTR